MTKIIREHYESLDTVAGKIRGNGKFKWEERKVSVTSDFKFTGTESLSEAEKLLTEGWPEGSKLVTANASAIEAVSTGFQTSPSIFMDVAGAYPIAALAAAGDSCAMVSLAPIEDRKRPIIRLVVQISVSAYYKKEEMQAYGIGLMAIIDNLEASSFRVELNVGFFAARQDYFAALTICLKQAHDPLDRERVVFGLAHPSMLRRIMFKVMEANCPGDVFASGYGTPSNPEAGKHYDPDMLFLPGPQTFRSRSAELQNPANTLKAMTPIINAALTDKYNVPPPLNFNMEHVI